MTTMIEAMNDAYNLGYKLAKDMTHLPENKEEKLASLQGEIADALEVLSHALKTRRIAKECVKAEEECLERAEKEVKDAQIKAKNLQDEFIVLGNEGGKEILSNCCSSFIIENTDVCGDCKEHTGGVDERGDEYEFSVNQWVKSMK